MCGIAGFSVSDADFKTLDRRRLSACLLMQIVSRGRHATGAAWTQFDPEANETSVWYAKQAVEASRFLPVLKNVPRRTRTVVLHTRYATQGSPKVEHNNHPIVVPGVVGVHNGHISNDDEIIRRAGGERTGEVDSEAAFRLIAQSDNVARDLPSLKGRAALGWITTDAPSVLHLARVQGSPLAIGQTRGGSLVFASTLPLLGNACKYAGVDLDFATEVDEMTYFRISKGVIHDWRSMGIKHPAGQGVLF